MSDRLIFVSCGQLTEDERRLGRRLKAEIDATEGFQAYFADTVQNLAGLSEHILDALRRCSGAVVVLHPRGTVRADDGCDLGVRSSPWINQEVAILAYRHHFEGLEIPILAFKHPAVRVEGAMTAFIVNPRPLEDEDSVVGEVRRWLAGEARRGRESVQQVFDQKWEQVTLEDRAILAALIAEGGRQVKEVSIRQRLKAHPGIGRDRASDVLRQRRLVLSQANLVQVIHNIYDGDEISLHPTWEWYIRHAVAQIGRDQQNHA